MGKCDKEAILLKEKTASSFGFEWAKFKDIFDSYEANFLSYISPIDKEFFKDKLVLDAGCGAGRHSYFAAKYGAKVVAFDLSKEVVRVASGNLKGLNAEVLQSDMYNFSYPQKFDYIFCIGVLHHLPDPQEGFSKLVSLLKENGTISIWVYGKKNNKLAQYIYEPLRKITTLIPHRILYCSVLPIALLVEITNRLKLPIFSYYAVFPFKTKWNDAFDVFSAPSAKYYDLHEIEDWFKQAGLRDVKVSYRMLDDTIKGVKGLGIK
jgi:SAM-dependent methyltransferase